MLYLYSHQVVKLAARIKILCVLTLLSFTSHAEQSADEHELRAAIVYRLLQASSWNDLDSKQIKVCVFGTGKNASALSQLDKLKLGPDKQLYIAPSPQSELDQCHVFVIGRSLEKPFPNTLTDRYVICNSCDKNQHLSTIDLFIHGDQVRYAINLAVAKKIGVHFRSEALKYALKVKQ